MKEKNLYNVQPAYAKQYILEYFLNTFSVEAATNFGVCSNSRVRFKATNEIWSLTFWSELIELEIWNVRREKVRRRKMDMVAVYETIFN